MSASIPAGVILSAARLGGLLCAYSYTASVQAERRLLTILMWIARVYLWRGFALVAWR